MSSYTNSEVVTQNEDGSWTTKIEYTQFPPTTTEKVATGAAIAVLLGLTFVPVIVARREERQARLRKLAEEAAPKKRR